MPVKKESVSKFLFSGWISINVNCQLSIVNWNRLR
mgnify:CR=1 FL=1